MNLRARFLSVVVVFVLFPAGLPVLARAIVEGTVMDREGTPVAKARVLVAPFTDPNLRSYPLKTNAKGKFFVVVANGEYVASVEAEDWAPDSVTIQIQSRRDDVPGVPNSGGALRPIYDWSGKTGPGEKPRPLSLGSEDRATVDFVLVDPEVLRKERTSELLVKTSRALERGDRAAAMRTVEEMLATSPGDPLGLTIRGYIRSDDGEYEKAETDLNQALEQDPGLYDARYLLASIYRHTDRPAEAVEAFRQAAADAANPEQKSKALLSVGEIERDAGNTDQAIAALEQAIDANPDLKSAVAPELANLYTKTGQVERAGEWLDAAAEEQVDPALQYNMAVVHFNKKEWEPAAAAFEKVLAADSAFADAHKNLATCLLNLDRRDESLEHFREYLALRPDAEDAGQIQALVDHLSK